MRRVFEYFHLSLKETHPLFPEPEETRESWLRGMLSTRFTFLHRGNEFTWLPNEPSPYIVGKVMRTHIEDALLPPDLGGGETEEELWRGAIVIVDPGAHKDGQLAAVEKRRDVGTPSAILTALLKAASLQADGTFTVEAKQIWDSADFFVWAEAKGNVVAYIKFDFVVPNMWGVNNRLEEDLRQTGDTTGAQKVKVELGGEGGVKTNNELVRTGVEYAGRGSGSVTAKAQDNDTFTSKSRGRTTTLDDVPDVSTLRKRRLVAWANRILGRESDVLPPTSGDPGDLSDGD